MVLKEVVVAKFRYCFSIWLERKKRKASVFSSGIQPKMDWISQILTGVISYPIIFLKEYICINHHLDHDA
jgi:hypothetical protein